MSPSQSVAPWTSPPLSYEYKNRRKTSARRGRNNDGAGTARLQSGYSGTFRTGAPALLKKVQNTFGAPPKQSGIKALTTIVIAAAFVSLVCHTGS